MSTDERTHYEVLGLPADADADQIKRAGRAHQRAHHPDVAGVEETGEYMRGQDALAVLSDPAARAAYDEALAAGDVDPADEGEPLDAWVSDIRTEPEPQPQPTPEHPDESPAPPPPPQSRPDPKDTTIYDLGPNAPVTAGAGLVAGVVASALADSGVSAATSTAVVAAVLVVATVVGLFNLLTPRQTRHIRTRNKVPTYVMAAGIVALAVAGYVGSMFVPDPAHQLRAGAGVFAAALAGYTTGRVLWQRGRDRKIMKRKLLAQGQLFGPSASGEMPAYLVDELAKFITARMRVFQRDDISFSHMVVDDRTVWLLVAVPGSPGAYRWSGRSLLVTSPTGGITQVAAGDFGSEIEAIRTALGRRADIRAVVAVNSSGVTMSHEDPAWPQVVSLSSLGRVMSSGTDERNRMCRSVAIDAWHAL